MYLIVILCGVAEFFFTIFTTTVRPFIYAGLWDFIISQNLHRNFTAVTVLLCWLYATFFAGLMTMPHEIVGNADLCVPKTMNRHQLCLCKPFIAECSRGSPKWACRVSDYNGLSPAFSSGEGGPPQRWMRRSKFQQTTKWYAKQYRNYQYSIYNRNIYRLSILLRLLVFVTTLYNSTNL